LKLLFNDKTERIRLGSVDSLITNTAHYKVPDFYLGQNQYSALSKLLFRGEYSVYHTYSDRF